MYVECGCHEVGSSSDVCDLYTGQCNCRPGVVGRTCNACAPGLFNLTLEGCFDCNCSTFSNSSQCSESGQCQCLKGVGGAKCDQCLPEYYNITADGCTGCECGRIGVNSRSNDCNPVTGQCPCIDGTTGRDCLECPSGHFQSDSPDTDVCEECVCSGHSQNCTSETSSSSLAAIQSNFRQLCTDNHLACDDGWMLLTASGQIAAPYGPRYILKLYTKISRN